MSSLIQAQVSTRLSTDEAGRFEAIGLPPGPTALVAEAHGLSSPQEEVTLEIDREAPELTLVLERRLEISGQVVSETGSGVPGAHIKAHSLEVLSPPVDLLVSDAEGHFKLDLPSRTRNILLNVGAPGFGLRILWAPARQEPMVVVLSQRSGTLSIELPDWLDRSLWDAPVVAVVHAAGFAGLSYLESWAALHGHPVRSENLYSIPFVEQGDYSVCLIRPQQLPLLLAGHRARLPCADGVLAAAGELSLSLARAQPP